MSPLSKPRITARRSLLAVLAVSLVVGVFAGLSWFMASRPNGVEEIGGPFALVDQNGRAVTDRDLLGHFILIYFGYTYCPDVCPTTLTTVVGALAAMGKDAEKVQPVFISIDPRRDTPSVMRDYVAAFSPRLLGLTGSSDAVAAAARAYRVYYAPHRTGDGPNDYTMDHSSILYLMDPEGRLKALIRADQTAAEMAAEIRRNV